MPAHSSRIYVAGDSAGKLERLIRATHPGHALRHAFNVRIATQDDLERLLSKGVKVENVGGAADPDPGPELPGINT